MEISKKDLGITDKEYNLWLKLSKDERLASAVSRTSPSAAFRLYHCFIDNPVFNERTYNHNREVAKKLGNYFLEENPLGRYHESIKDSLENLDKRGRRIFEHETIFESGGNYSEVNPKEIKERLEYLINQRGAKTSEFLNSIRTNRRYFKRNDNKDQDIRLRTIDKICRAGDFSMDYAVFGLGPKFISIPEKINSLEFLTIPEGKRVKERIRRLSKNRGKNLRDFFIKNGYPTDSYKKISANGGFPNLRFLREICNYMEFSLNEIIYGTNNSAYLESRYKVMNSDLMAGRFTTELFGKRLKSVLDFHDLSQSELARRVNVSLSSINQAINGHKAINLRVLDAICKECYTTPDYLIAGMGPKNKIVDPAKNKKLRSSVYSEKHLGYRLSRAIEDLRITKKEAAKRAQINQYRFYNITHGTDSLSLKSLFNLCHKLKIKPNYLFYELELE